jgi:hypothetical protein
LNSHTEENTAKMAKKSDAGKKSKKSNSNIHPFPIRQTGIKFDHQNFIIYISSTPAVLLSYPLVSFSRNSVLYSTDSPEVFSNKSKILFADPSLASGSTVSYSM